MSGPIVVSWNQGSEFVRLVRDEVARVSKRRWHPNDPLEALSEVWIGLDPAVEEGQTLIGDEIGRLRIIIRRRISNHFKNQRGGRSVQPRFSLSEHTDLVITPTMAETPARWLIFQELSETIKSGLAEMPPLRAEAVRSRIGFPGATEWGDLVRTSGTTRQNLAKHAKKGFEDLRHRLA